MKKIFLLFSLMVCMFVIVPTVQAMLCFDPVAGEPVILYEQPECDGGAIEFRPSPGNAHAVMHGNRVKLEGRGVCTPCHNGESAIVESDRFICSQYDFQPEGRKVSDGNGGFVKDPVSGNDITSGKGIAVLLTGDIITCKICHYPHNTPDFKAEDYLIHEGCLDCHVNVGSSDLANEEQDEGDLDPLPGSDQILFTKTPWSDLCNDCHKQKSWDKESHKKHAEKRVACDVCHIVE